MGVKFLLFICFLYCGFKSANGQIGIASHEKSISKIVVYYLPKDRGGPIGITDSNIRNISITSKFEISDSLCLSEIQKNIVRLKKIKAGHVMRSIYLLCDIEYRNGTKTSISFEKAQSGVTKFQVKMYENSPQLETWIIGCINKSF